MGELQDLRQAVLPIAAALGRMLIPAEVYLMLQWGEPGARGWGIPMATDIAFVVGFLIMPVFALANAGVPIQAAAFLDPVAIATALGLVFGKPVGILLFSWLAVKFKLARLPEGVNWGVILGGSFLAGIGFTMALFISGLALSGPVLDAAKVGVMAGSALSAIAGMTLLVIFLPKPSPIAGQHTATM